MKPAGAAKTEWQIAIYFLLLLLFFNLGTPGSTGLAYIPIQFYLKNTLHLSAGRVAQFGFWTNAPLFVGFAFGFLRDHYQPKGWGDRAYFLVLPPLVAASYFYLARTHITYDRLLIATLIGTVFTVLLGAGIQGLLTAIAQRRAMAGRLSAVLWVATYLPTIIASQAGGWLGDHASNAVIFALAAGLVLVISAMAFLRPRTVFTESEGVKQSGDAAQTLKRLVLCHELYLPAAIIFLFNFAPGWQTPLIYFLTNTAHLSETQYGTFTAVQNVGMLVFAALYGVACPRLNLRTLLWVGTAYGTLACPLFLLIRGGGPVALTIAFVTGGSLGVAMAAYYDLLARACPKDLEGAAFLFGAAMYNLAFSGSDVFGAWLYERGGFHLALWVTAITTALILPLLPFVPRRLTETRDGETPGEDAPPVLAAVAETAI